MIALVCQEFGQARYLNSLATGISEPIAIVTTPRVSSAFSEFSEQIRRELPPPGVCRALVTGSAPGDSLDSNARRWAREHGIPSISVIEHWSWVRERFTNESNLLELPLRVFVNDKISKRRALEAGIPSQVIRIVGNPRLEELQREGYEARSRFTQDRSTKTIDRRSIGFISEEISNSWTADKLPFTEFDVLEDLIAVSETREIVIYLHPDEAPEKYREYLGPRVTTSHISSHLRVSLLHDKIVGMHSIMLLELAYFNCSVVSYTPEANKFVTPPPGVDSIHQPEELGNWLAKNGGNTADSLPDFLGSRELALRALEETRQFQ